MCATAATAAFAISLAATLSTVSGFASVASFRNRQRWPDIPTWLQPNPGILPPQPGVHSDAENDKPWLHKNAEDAENDKTLTHNDAEAALVRVYVYEDQEGTGWLKKCDSYTFSSQNFMPDPSLHNALLKHPWRTLDASNADLFFVPIYWGNCGNQAENMAATTKMLQESEYFKKNNGSDHVVSAFAWSAKPEKMGALLPLTANMIIGRFELESSFGSYPREFVLPYGGADSRNQKPATTNLAQGFNDWKARKHSLFMMGQADSRHAYRERRIALRKLSDAFPDAVLIQTDDMKFANWEAKDPLDTPDLREELPMCKELLGGSLAGCRRLPESSKDYVGDYIELGRNSKFVLAMHGDTPSSSRVYDAFQFGAVPIFVAPGWDSHAIPFPSEIPWKDFAVFIDQDKFIKDPVGETRAAVAVASEEGRQASIVKFRSAVDWTVPGHCVGTVVLTHIARHFLGKSTLEPGTSSTFCT